MGLVPVIALVASVITFGRLKAEIQMLQTDIIVLAAYLLAIYWLDRQPILAGMVLGFGMNIKYYTAPALFYLLLRRRWTAATSFIVSAVVFALLPALKLGLTTDWRYLRIATGGVLRSIGMPVTQQESAHVHKIYEDLSISVTSGIARVVLHTHPTATMPLTGLVIAISLIFAAGCYRLRRLPFLLWPGSVARAARPSCRWLHLNGPASWSPPSRSDRIRTCGTWCWFYSRICWPSLFSFQAATTQSASPW